MAARLREHYLKKVVPALTKEFGYTNVMAVPKIEKISINIGLGEATQNAKLMDGAVNELGQIAGQKPVITKASKSIAQFKLREGQSIGCMVTLRGARMYEFFDRLISVAVPRSSRCGAVADGFSCRVATCRSNGAMTTLTVRRAPFRSISTRTVSPDRSPRSTRRTESGVGVGAPFRVRILSPVCRPARPHALAGSDMPRRGPRPSSRSYGYARRSGTGRPSLPSAGREATSTRRPR